MEFLNDYINLVALGLCLCVGYIIKTSLDFIPNKYIPLIMAILGVVVTIWYNFNMTLETILEGMFTGLASTGMHQLFKELIEKGDYREGDENNGL